ncbi:OpcA/G6PD domain-containing protein, partial [Mycobacterium kansasii]
APAVPSADKVGALATRRITDATASDDSVAVLAGRRDGFAPGDSDLAWSRITPWRALLASALDQPPFEPITSAVVTGPSNSPGID